MGAAAAARPGGHGKGVALPAGVSGLLLSLNRAEGVSGDTSCAFLKYTAPAIIRLLWQSVHFRQQADCQPSTKAASAAASKHCQE